MKKRIKITNEVVLVILIVVVAAVFGMLNSRFVLISNILQYLNNGVVLGFLALGLSVSIISGNFDYSIGSMLGFGTVIMAFILNRGFSVPLAMIIGLLSLVLFGLLNGVLVGFYRVPGMLATLGTSSLIYGFSLVMTKGQAIASKSDSYRFFGRSDVGSIPFGVILVLVVSIISYVLLKYSAWGRRVYTIGSSTTVARFAGVNIVNNILLVHVFSAIMCFCGALILGSRMASGRADIGAPYVLQAVTASVFGGIDIKGGKGSVVGALLGVVLFTLLSSGFTMIGVSQFYKQVVTGGLLIAVLSIRNIFDKTRR